MSQRKIYNYITLLFIALASILLLSQTTFAASTQVNWQTYDDAIFAKSTKDKRPVLLFVKADWCPHCEKMRSTILTDDSVVKMVNESFIPVMVDVDKERNVAMKYNVTGLPTFIILNGKGKVVKEFSGESTIVDFLQKLSQGYRDYEKKSSKS